MVVPPLLPIDVVVVATVAVDDFVAEADTDADAVSNFAAVVVDAVADDDANIAAISFAP